MNDFDDLIKKDRAKKREEKWKGTFVEYLERVKSDPSICMLAHERMHNVVSPSNFFEDEFFGIENVIAKIKRYFHAASLKGEESRQVLYLMGPVGAGKSSIAEKIQRGLEETDVFYAIKGCPMHEEPLHLIPRHLREKFEEMLDVKIEGDLCPVCRYRLTEEFSGNYEDMSVVTVSPSKRARRGIAIVPPVDPNNQDTSVLIGSEDISKLDKYSEGDPRVLDLSGAFNVGNRGLVEFVEVFKNEAEYLHVMITATQEKSIPAPGRHGIIYVDTVIIAHSNEAEWNKFGADHCNEAILDRIVMIRVPYNLRLSEEIKIYRKMLGRSGFGAHIAPHSIEIASMFAVLSRLESSDKCDRMTKLRIYNGEEVIDQGATVKISEQELREDVKREGMDGISTRFIMKALDNALSENPEGINPINVREALVAMVKDSDISDDKKALFLELLQDTIHKAYLEILEKEITKAFVYAYEEQADTLFENYLDHAEAYVNKKKVKDRSTNEELEPDEDLLKSIEEQIGITGTAADGFRQEVIAYLWSVGRRDEKVTFRSYGPLKEAVEKKLMMSVRDLSRIVTKSRTRDKEQRDKYNNLVKSMLERGYDEHSAEVVLKYAANNLWKD
ncbi:MAG: PrkA family serine protein kinase [Patescibacteria group bacterium]|nr:MAG: PrkA family serine protein kinase [Patescibacteria group bacterium]